MVHSHFVDAMKCALRTHISGVTGEGEESEFENLSGVKEFIE